MSAEIDDLIERWLEGSLNAEQETELQSWLHADPNNMQAFTEANIRHQMLQDAVRRTCHQRDSEYLFSDN